MARLQDRLDGAGIVAITAELERYTRSVQKKLNLKFDILTNLHLKTAERFGLVFALPDSLRDLYKSFGSTLDRFHDESEYRLPMPAIRDRSGRNHSGRRCKRGLHEIVRALVNSPRR